MSNDIEIILVGEQGPSGQGVPAGGTTGQFLRKVSDTDFDADWTDSSASVESINDVNDVVITTPQDGDSLVYDTSNGRWVNQSILDGQVAVDQHVALEDPHPQYLTTDDLPSTFDSWFTNNLSSIDASFLAHTESQSQEIESVRTLSVTSNNTPTLVGQWLREPVSEVAYTWNEVSNKFIIEMESDRPNTFVYAEIYLRKPDLTLTLIGTSPLEQIRESRQILSFDAVVQGPVDIEVGDTSVVRLYCIKDGGPSANVSLYMEGDTKSRVISQSTIATFPANHASTHEVGGDDLINHDNLTGAQGFKSHSQIDTDLASLQTSKSNVGHTHVKADITDFSDSDYATAAQGTTADTALQPGANISELVNNAGYLTETVGSTMTSGDIPSTTVSVPVGEGEQKVLVVGVKGYEPSTNDTFWKYMRLCAKTVSGITTLVGGVSTDLGYDTGASNWTAVASTGSGSVSIVVTGEIGKTINWSANVEVK